MSIWYVVCALRPSRPPWSPRGKCRLVWDVAFECGDDKQDERSEDWQSGAYESQIHLQRAIDDDPLILPCYIGGAKEMMQLYYPQNGETDITVLESAPRTISRCDVYLETVVLTSNRG